jgi:hypothetical protein
MGSTARTKQGIIFKMMQPKGIIIVTSSKELAQHKYKEYIHHQANTL